jgi:hypothetical protein
LELNISNKRFDFEIEVLALHNFRGGSFKDVEVKCFYPPKEDRITHFDIIKDNLRLSLTHTKLIIQKFFFLRGILWK